MRVVLAPTRFAGTLTAGEATRAMAAGWRAAAPHDDLVPLPLSDGGPGFVDVLAAGLGGDVLAATVPDPLGRDVPATVLVVDGPTGRTAYVESTQAVGRDLVAAGGRDPAHTSSAGLASLLELALSTHPGRVVVGVADSATHDAGAGLLAALGAGSPARLGAGGLALASTGPDDLRLEATVARFREVTLVMATSSTLPLLGFHGASAAEAQDRGATAEQAQMLEAALGHWVDVVGRAHPQPRDLLTGAARRPEREPGAGAAGGLGYALLLLGARRVDGAALVADALGLADAVRGADLVVTGEGTYDWRSLRDSVPAAVSDAALAAGVPTVLLAG
jgi:glycerate kinase